MKDIELSELLLCFTREAVEFALDRTICNAEWHTFLNIFDIIPTVTWDRAIAALAVEFEAFAHRGQRPFEAAGSQWSAQAPFEELG